MLAMKDQIAVRAARAEDEDAILPFCQNTFSWGDYISEAWDYWLKDTHGQMCVGVANGKPIGMIHVAFLRDSTAWMEGMRVHPEYRRLGIASAMDAAGRAYARSRGCKLARLATGTDNLAAQKTLEGQGYKRIAQYGEWSAKPGRTKIATRADERDLPRVLADWQTVPEKIIADPYWRWQKLNDADMACLIQRGEILLAPHGFALLREMNEPDGLILHALVGSDDAMLALAQSARAEVNYRGYERVDAEILDDVRINRALERTGFKRAHGMFIYEQAL